MSVLEALAGGAMTLAGIVVGFYLGRMPVDVSLKLPKRRQKPQPMTVMSREGKVQKKEEPEVNPILNFKEPGA